MCTDLPLDGSKPDPIHEPPPGRWRQLRKTVHAHHGKTTLVLLGLIFALALGFTDTLLAGPMRTWAERVMNSKLNGYTVRIGSVRPHVWKLAFELENLVVTQNTHPDPPVADFDALKFSLLWTELRHFKVAGNLTLVRPALHINLAQITEEAASKVSLKDRGWQSAVESIYPIKLNQVKVQDGSLLYLAEGTASKPLQLTKVNMVAANVRNIASAQGIYPSPVTLDGVLFDTGKLWFQGQADFLREPHAAAQGEIRLEKVPLERLNPLAQDYQLTTKGGLLSMNGVLEYTPEFQLAHLREVLFENLQVDYITSNATKTLEREHAKQVAKLAKRVREAPQLMLQVKTLKLTNSQIGFVNEATRPPYRLYIANASLDLENLSNEAYQGRSAFRARGAFMGSGTTVITGGFQPTATQADFDVRLKLDDARLPALNGFLKAHEGVDVADGLFSLYTEIKVKNGKIEGYLKPLIKNLKIYDREKDKDKPFGKRVKLHVLQFLATLFKNRTTREVATVIRISGSTSDPTTRKWEVIRKLIANGLFRGILPGFLDKPPALAPPPPEKGSAPLRPPTPNP